MYVLVCALLLQEHSSSYTLVFSAQTVGRSRNWFCKCANVFQESVFTLAFMTWHSSALLSPPGEDHAFRRVSVSQQLISHTTGPISLIIFCIRLWLHAQGPLVVAVIHNSWKEKHFNWLFNINIDCWLLIHLNCQGRKSSTKSPSKRHFWQSATLKTSLTEPLPWLKNWH